jgi:hypothetical protein
VPIDSRIGRSTSICPGCRNRCSKIGTTVTATWTMTAGQRRMRAVVVAKKPDACGPYLAIETNNYGSSDNEPSLSRIQAYLSHQTMSISNSAKPLGRRFGVCRGITEESNTASGLGKFTFWLSSLAALLSFSAAIFCLQVTRTQRTTDPDQVGLAAEDLPNEATVSLAQAIQALRIRN